MPQIWITYEEMAGAFAVPPAEVRTRCLDLGLARMKSSDGTTRVRLTEGMACRYLAALLAEQAGERSGPRHEIAALEALLAGRGRPQGSPASGHSEAA